MLHYRKEPFEVSRTDQGGWVVDFEGKRVTVSSHSDAMLLADLPAQLYKAVSKDQKPNLNKIGRILALYDEYHLQHIPAVKQLKSWFKRIGANKA